MRTNTTICGRKHCWKIKIQVVQLKMWRLHQRHVRSRKGFTDRKPKQVEVSYREIAKH
jgi:hypothetical protein